MNSKLKNYGLWVSLFALGGMILIDTKMIAELTRYEQYVKMILGIAVAAGVISNPSSGKWFVDKQE